MGLHSPETQLCSLGMILDPLQWSDYCNMFYIGLPLESMGKFQGDQKVADRLTGAGYSIRAAPLAANLFQGTIQSTSLDL